MDTTGPKVIEFLTRELEGALHHFPEALVIADDPAIIAKTVSQVCDVADPYIHLVVTCGGTGFGVRDCTPEAVKPILEKEAPGIVHAMVQYGLTKTPYAWLSRPVAGVRSGTVVICVPGSPTAAIENLTPLVKHGLKHAVELASGDVSRLHPTADPAPPLPAVDATPAVASGEPSVADRPRNSNYPMLPMDEALSTIASECKARSKITRTTNAREIISSTLAFPMSSRLNMPPFRASIKDGYAVVASDGAGVYPLTNAFTAGSELTGFKLQPGEICRVSTGGPVPDGADAVIQVEDTEVVSLDASGKEEATVSINKAVAPGNDIRPVGCDIKNGDVVLPEGTIMGPAEIALWLSIGSPEVQVYSKPSVAVLSTGNELWAPDADPSAPSSHVDPRSGLQSEYDIPEGKIADSNRGMLIAALELSGMTSSVVNAGIAPDVLAITVKRIQDAWEKADVIISSGGVSMGELDYVKTALIQLGATIHFGRVCMKPGKPTTFATLGEKVFFALPGNPVSALVCYHVFVVPALRVMRGISPDLPTIEATLTHDVRLDKERPDFHRCTLKRSPNSTSELLATTTGIQASHRLLSMVGANGLMKLPQGTPDAPTISKGSRVEVVFIGELLK